MVFTMLQYFFVKFVTSTSNLNQIDFMHGHWYGKAKPFRYICIFFIQVLRKNKLILEEVVLLLT